MRLDYDCIRDILFTVEETTALDTPCFINQDYQEYDRLKKYDFSVLAYHVHQCALSELFTYSEFDGKWNCKISDLSPKGHEFIANIRDNSFWGSVKKKIAELGSVSLSMIPQIASSLALAKLGVQ